MCNIQSNQRYVFTPSSDGWKANLEDTVVTAR
jgi:hypothetical protein